MYSVASLVLAILAAIGRADEEEESESNALAQAIIALQESLASSCSFRKQQNYASWIDSSNIIFPSIRVFLPCYYQLGRFL